MIMAERRPVSNEAAWLAADARALPVVSDSVDGLPAICSHLAVVL
jgi:hypothetical protein